MRNPSPRACRLGACISLVLLIATLTGAPARAATAPSKRKASGTAATQLSNLEDRIEVIATRIPEPPDDVPAGIEVFTGEELRRRGVTDLAGALALAAGVDIAPGGDSGPASSVPEIWGLREFDAFLLVVDNVPWGGAFNPSVATLSMRDVERVEVLRGPAPVTFGATSFAGVIHVVHSQAAADSTYAGARGGSFGSGGASVDLPLTSGESWESRLSLDADRQGYSDDRTAYDRGHALWRAARSAAEGSLWFTVDGAWLDQDPASPHPREAEDLSGKVPLDANHNPEGAYLKDLMFTAAFGADRPVGAARWGLLASISHTDQENFRGFIDDVAAGGATGIVPARGIYEEVDIFDLYLDTHFSWSPWATVRLVTGADFLHGDASAEGADFDYDVRLDGSPATHVSKPSDLPIHIDDRREFLGGYLLSEWTPVPKVRFSGGLRLNYTFEEREGKDEADPNAPPGGEEGARHSEFRPGGSVGVLFMPRERETGYLRFFVNYRDTYKPAAVDLGIGEEAAGGGGEEELLDPETSRSVDGGVKYLGWERRLSLEADIFWMDFRNLVTSTTVNGLPELINAGNERFRGIDTALDVRLPGSMSARATYSYHDATFEDFVQEFGGVPTQLAGNRLEMSARHLVSGGIVYAPERGFTAGVEARYVGSRYLNKRNTAPAGGFTTLGAGIGYRFDRWEIRADGRNLTDERDPIAESELGDAQYYLQPARRIDVSAAVRF